MEKQCVRTSPWDRRSELPELPLPGAAAAAALLLLLGAVSAQNAWLSLPGAVVCGTLLAALLLLHRTLLSPAAALGCAVLIVWLAPGAFPACAACLFLPLGFGAAAAVYAGLPRMHAVAISSGCAAVCAAGAAAVLSAAAGLSPREGLLRLQSGASARLAAYTVTVAGGEVQHVFSEETAALFVRYLLMLSPAILCVGFFLAGFAVTMLLRLAFSVLGADADFLPSDWRLRAGRALAAVYCAAQLCTLLAATTRNAQPAYYAAYNTVLVFTAPLAAAGLSDLMEKLRRSPSIGAFTKLALSFLVLMIALSGLYWLITAAALYGVYTAFRRPAQNK
ncbi:MAG: DUF2232 domain-containing protein [Eubacteriales bacterium]